MIWKLLFKEASRVIASESAHLTAKDGSMLPGCSGCWEASRTYPDSGEAPCKEAKYLDDMSTCLVTDDDGDDAV